MRIPSTPRLTRGLLALALSCAFAGSAIAQPKAVRVTNREAAIRAEPNRRSALVGRAPEGAVLDVLGQENDWYKVSIPERLRTSGAAASGFVETRQVTQVTDPSGEAITPRQPATATQAQRGRLPTRKAPFPLRIRGFGTLLFERFQAVNSFEALYGSASAPVFGGGVDVSLGRRLFVQVDVSHVRRSGERAFVFNGEVFPLGIEQQMRLTPLAVNVGYRPVRPPARRVTPYVGGGVGFYFYRETSGVGGDGAFSTSGFGAQAIGGAEYRVSRWVSAAAEAGYRHVPGILGDAGVSKEFGEKNLGGFTVGVKVLIGR
jgi:opacity protein-like surface antigen